MFAFPKQERVTNLLHEAVTRLPYLGSGYFEDLNHEFSRVQSLLDAEPVGNGQKTLLLGLARQHINRAEKYTVKQMIGSSYVSAEQMSHLVRVQLICAELGRLFSQGLSEFKNHFGDMRQ